MKAILTILSLAAISAGIFVLGSLRPSKSDQSLLRVAQEVGLPVNVAKPTRGEIIRHVQAPGDVEAVLEVEISSEIVAKINEMPVEEGDAVKQGDLLCRLDDRYLQAEVESAQARIAQIRASILQADVDMQKAQRDMQRQQTLSEKNATSDLELQDYLTTWQRSKAVKEMRVQELAQAEAGRKRIREDLEKTVICSPIDGVISRLAAKQGEVVVTGTMNNPGTVIMTISDMSRMQVRARVDEVDVPLVRANQPSLIYLQAEQDRPVPARVVRVASKGTRPAGRDVVTFETLLEVLSNDARIKPGMTANVEIEVAKKDDAITVPVEAVVHRMRKDLPEAVVKTFDEKQRELEISERAREAQYIKVVYVMEEEKARVRLVEPGIADTRRVELMDGVGLEDSVIIGPYRSLDQLEDGKKVALTDKDKKKDEKAVSPEGDGAERTAEDTEKQDAEGKGEATPATDQDGEKTASAGRTP